MVTLRSSGLMLISVNNLQFRLLGRMDVELLFAEKGLVCFFFGYKLAQVLGNTL